MSAPLSEQQLAEIAARAAAATAGPWMADGAEIYRAPWGYVVIDMWVGETLRIEDQGASNADAEFVAHAREDVPALLAEVARLREERHSTNEALDEVVKAVATVRDDRDMEIVRWLNKKAREYRSTGSRQHAFQAEAIELMASKITSGAVLVEAGEPR